MQKLARLAIQRRWLVIGAWLAFIVLAQGISGALGGANYKDTFSLPHTETASVAKVLKNAGLDNQNGATGTVVLKAKTGTSQSAPAGLAPALRQAVHVGQPGQHDSHSLAVDRLHQGGATTAGDPKLLNTAKGSTTGLVNITWTSNHYDQKLFTNVFNELKNLRSDALQVEFTGNAFQTIGQSKGRAAVRLRFHRRADHPAHRLPHRRRPRRCRWPARSPHSAPGSGSSASSRTP